MAEGFRYFAKMADRLTESSGNRATSGPKKQEIFVKEELKIAVKFTLDKFRYDEEQKGIILSDFAMFCFKEINVFLWSHERVSRTICVRCQITTKRYNNKKALSLY